MWRYLLIILLLFCTSAELKAQLFEAGVFIGGSNYQGDLADVAFTLSEFHTSIGIVARINPSRFFSFKGGIYYGQISGEDANSSKDYLVWRNLSFRSKIYEASIQGEINILGYKLKGKGFRVTPYTLIGIGFFRFDPETLYQSSWVKLHPLGTEGQNLPQYADRAYKLSQISIPLGVGLKYKVTEVINLSLEFGFRKTFTDYLDDISTEYVDKNLLQESGGTLAAALSDRSAEVLGYSKPSPGEQRGDPTDKDWYLFSGFNLTFSIVSAGGGLRGGKKGSGCFGF